MVKLALEKLEEVEVLEPLPAVGIEVGVAVGIEVGVGMGN